LVLVDAEHSGEHHSMAVHVPGVGPWFRRHPRLAVAAALALITGITVLRFSIGDETDATALLYALPISLIALAFGLRAGTATAVVCLLLLVSWVVVAGATIGPLGWASRITPLLFLGILIGRASDVQRDADAVAIRLTVSEVRRRDAAEINDIVVQHLAAAKWRLEQGAVDEALVVLEEAMEAGQGLVCDLLVGLDDARRRHDLQSERA
jgi:hypothetical protein